MKVRKFILQCIPSESFPCFYAVALARVRGSSDALLPVTPWGVLENKVRCGLTGVESSGRRRRANDEMSTVSSTKDRTVTEKLVKSGTFGALEEHRTSPHNRLFDLGLINDVWALRFLCVHGIRDTYQPRTAVDSVELWQPNHALSSLCGGIHMGCTRFAEIAYFYSGEEVEINMFLLCDTLHFSLSRDDSMVSRDYLLFFPVPD